jgi:hypothetical protein
MWDSNGTVKSAAGSAAIRETIESFGVRSLAAASAQPPALQLFLPVPKGKEFQPVGCFTAGKERPRVALPPDKVGISNVLRVDS